MKENLTPQYLQAAARALDLLVERAYVCYLDNDDNEHECHLRGWADDSPDVRDRAIRITTRSGMENDMKFTDLVDLTLAHRIAKA